MLCHCRPHFNSPHRCSSSTDPCLLCSSICSGAPCLPHVALLSEHGSPSSTYATPSQGVPGIDVACSPPIRCVSFCPRSLTLVTSYMSMHLPSGECGPSFCFCTLINRTSMPVPQQPHMRGITSSGFGSSTRGTTGGAEAAILCSIPVSHFVLDNLVIILLICGIIQYVFSGMIIWDNPVIVRCFVASYATPLT